MSVWSTKAPSVELLRAGNWSFHTRGVTWLSPVLFPEPVKKLQQRLVKICNGVSRFRGQLADVKTTAQGQFCAQKWCACYGILCSTVLVRVQGKGDLDCAQAKCLFLLWCCNIKFRGMQGLYFHT